MDDTTQPTKPPVVSDEDTTIPSSMLYALVERSFEEALKWAANKMEMPS